VKTDVVVAVGREADFILVAAEGINELLALQATVLQVASLEDPEQKIILSDFQRAVIQQGILPSTVEMIPAEQAAQLVSQFYQVPEGILYGMAMKRLDEEEGFEDEDILEQDIEGDIEERDSYIE
jgi:hypothetical protein